MYKFIKKADTNNPYDTTDVEFTTNSDCLENLLEEFQNFLKGCGFVIDNHQTLVFISDQDLINEDTFDSVLQGE